MNIAARLASALASSALVLAGTAFVAPAAQAHDGGGNRCVTKHEWRHIHQGMKKKRVTAIFDQRGTPGHDVWWLYYPCAWNGGTDIQLWVEYDYGRPNRVKSKTTY